MRYEKGKVTSHAGTEFEATPVEAAGEVPALVEKGTTVVALDEAQFFDPAVVAVVQQLADRGLRIIVAGLDMDFRGEPFGAMPLSLSAVLVDMALPVSTISALQPGQVLPVSVARSIPLKAGGQTIAHGTIGALDDRVAVQITHAF